MNRRRRFLVAGIGLFAVAVAEILVPGLLPIPVGDTAVYLVGAVLLLYAYGVLKSSRSVAFDQAETPDPEVPVSTPAPGDDFDDALAQFRKTDGAFLMTPTVRGLTAAAVAVLRRYTDRSESQARRQVEDGTWTTDPDAAAFLSEEGVPSRPVAERLRRWLSTESRYRRNVRHTVEAIADVADVRSANPQSDTAISRRLLNAVTSTSPMVVEESTVDPEPTESDDGSRVAAQRATRHWTGVSFVALACLGVGLLVERPAVLLAGIVGIGYAAYARSSSLEPVEISVDRSFSDDDPQPGDDVDVTVTVTNEGPRFRPDVRVVDGVPDALAVTDGTPRCGTALRSGSSTEYTYTVTARRGRHEFPAALVVVRNLPSAVEREMYVTAASTLTCVPSLRPTAERVPLRSQLTDYVGVVGTDSGGDGLEFHTTREYRPGDPMNRIDWNRRARSGDLGTLEFRQERAANVVLLIDVRASAYVSPEPYADHAVDRSVEAARRVFARLLDDGHRVGIATMGTDDCWLPPDAGSDHRSRGRSVLATDPAFRSVPRTVTGDIDQWKRRFRRRLPGDAQLVVFSPLCDSSTVRTVRELDAHGHLSTVVSPDPSADRTVGHRLMRVHRTIAITDLRRSGIPVIDWEPGDSLDEALATAGDRTAP